MDISDLKVSQAKAGYSYVLDWGKVGELWEEDKAKKPIEIPDQGERTIDLYNGEIHYTITLFCGG